MRFDIHRIHVAVFGKGQRKAANRPRTIPIAEVVAEGLVQTEYCGHGYALRADCLRGRCDPVSAAARSAPNKSCSMTFMMRSYKFRTRRLQRARDTQGMMLLPLALSASERK